MTIEVKPILVIYYYVYYNTFRYYTQTHNWQKDAFHVSILGEPSSMSRLTYGNGGNAGHAAAFLVDLP